MTSVGNAEANGGTDGWSPESPRRGRFLLFFHVFLSGKSARNFSETMLQKAGGNSGFFMCVESKMMVETNQKHPKITPLYIFGQVLN
jgi:hypothetical protein